MNKRQAMRIALATEACYILNGAPTEAITNMLSDDDCRMFHEVQKKMAMDMLLRAGFYETMSAEEIIREVLG